VELLGVLRLLGVHRKLIALGVIVAVLAGVAESRRIERQTASGAAAVRLLIAPPDSETNDADAHPTDELVTRTKLLGDLLSDARARAAIAARAGIAPEQLVVEGPATLPPWAQFPMAISATEAAAVAGTPYILTLEAATANPIMTMTGGAPTQAEAIKLVGAGTDALRALLDHGSRLGHAVAVQSLGPVGSRVIVAAHSKILVAILPVVVFGLWCVGIVLVAGFARQRRTARAARRTSLAFPAEPAA
jgi:hypothetical protein